MSFVCTVDAAENKHLWCRCLHALAALSEDVQFVATPTQLFVSGRNAGDTTFMDVVFQRAFFKIYEFYPDRIASNEGTHTWKSEPVYAFTVRSKLLSMLFKKHEDDVENFKLSVNATEECPTNLKFRLQIDVMTKSSILKRFTPFYIPVHPILSQLADHYKENFVKQKAEHQRLKAGGINYMMLGNAMIKGFLDNSGASTEHLRFEVNAQKFSVTAFTRGVYIKEKEILKQPMAVNMQLRSDDLHALELCEDSVNVVLRLKDFKNFLTLVHLGEVTECYFRKAGDPIMFELLKNNVTIQLIQDTDGDNHITIDHPTKVQRAPAQRQQQPRTQTPQQQRPVQQAMRSVTATPSVDKEEGEQVTDPLFVHDEDNDIDNQDDRGDQIDPEPTVPSPSRGASQDSPEITWGDPSAESLTLKKLMSTRKQVIEDARVEYLESLKKRKLEKEKESQGETQDEVDMLGPTQDVRKAKGLFD